MSKGMILNRRTFFAFVAGLFGTRASLPEVSPAKDKAIRNYGLGPEEMQRGWARAFENGLRGPRVLGMAGPAGYRSDGAPISTREFRLPFKIVKHYEPLGTDPVQHIEVPWGY